MIRIGDKDKFEYLLARGILPSITDLEGCNALHYAARIDRLEFLSYMLEGDYHAYEYSNSIDFLQTFSNLSHNRSIMI